jgi:hypothetical protein
MDSAKGNYVTNTIVPPLRKERMERREERGRREELRQTTTTLPAWTHNNNQRREYLHLGETAIAKNDARNHDDQNHSSSHFSFCISRCVRTSAIITM